MELPTHTAAGHLRRTLLLQQELDTAHQSQAQVLLTGPGIHDFLITGAGESRRLTGFLDGYCRARGIGLVRYTMSDGIRTYATLPGDQAVPVRMANPDHTPAQAVQQLIADLR